MMKMVVKLGRKKPMHKARHEYEKMAQKGKLKAWKPKPEAELLLALEEPIEKGDML
jgi:hypothetical protein